MNAVHLPSDASRQQYASYMPTRQYNIRRKSTKKVNPPTTFHINVVLYALTTYFLFLFQMMEIILTTHNYGYNDTKLLLYPCSPKQQSSS